jgi:hypothetical protein
MRLQPYRVEFRNCQDKALEKYGGDEQNDVDLRLTIICWAEGYHGSFREHPPVTAVTADTNHRLYWMFFRSVTPEDGSIAVRTTDRSSDAHLFEYTDFRLIAFRSGSEPSEARFAWLHRIRTSF